MHALLKDCLLVVPHTVAWGEMDAFQHVNNVEYFRYFENARIEHFERSGIFQVMKETQKGPILAETRCRFKAPLTFPDTVYIGLSISDVGEDCFTHHYTIVSEQLNRVVAEGEGKIVFYDYAQGCRTAIPQSIAEGLG